MQPPHYELDWHAERRMRQRHIDAQDIEYVVTNYDARRPAQLIQGKPASEIFIATVRGRRLRVYAEEDTDPIYVTTVAWEDHD